MSIIFKIVPISNDGHCLFLHPNQFKLINETTGTTTISFGLKEMEVTYQQSDMLSENEIGVTNTIIENLQFPLGVDYEIAIHNGNIIIGPFIGILIAKSHSKIKRKLKKQNRIIEQYPLLNGVIIAFSWEDMDHKTETIIGYLYNSSTKNWEKGTFPFPTVLVKGMVLSKNRIKFLKNLYGSRFFNTNSINKWKMYQYLSDNKELLPHLPKTALYTRPKDILNGLNRFGTIYVKPIYGLKGNGIMKMVAEPSRYSIQYRFKQKNKKIYLSTENELLNYVKNHLKKNKYIIQEQIDSQLQKGHIIDFRIFLVKNQTGKWENVGMIARKGSKGSIVSNLSNGGRTNKVIKLMAETFHVSEAQVLSIQETMSGIAIKAAEEIDQYENIYWHGVDIAIDRHQHISLIELNHRYPAFKNSFPKDAVTKIYYSKLSYAKYLAGFPIDKEK